MLASQIPKHRTDTYAYDAYGSVIAHNGSTHDNPYQFVGALGYYTPWQAPEFRLLQLGFRFYDPGAGRFTQQDPAGAGVNWYAYAGGNPLTFVDPWGLSWLGNLYNSWASGDWAQHLGPLYDWTWNYGYSAGKWQGGRGSGWSVAGNGLLTAGGITGASFLVLGVGETVGAVGTAIKTAAAGGIALLFGSGGSQDASIALGYSQRVLDRAASAGDLGHNFPSVFRDLRSGHGVMMRMPIGRPLRKSRNGAA